MTDLSAWLEAGAWMQLGALARGPHPAPRNWPCRPGGRPPSKPSVQGPLGCSPSLPSDFLRAAGREVRSLVGRIEGRTASRHAVTSCQSGSLPDPLNTVRHRVGRASFRSGTVGRSPCPLGVVGQAVRQSIHRVFDGRHVGLLSAQACVEALPVGLTVNRVLTLRLFGLLLDAKSVRLCPARGPAQC